MKTIFLIFWFFLIPKVWAANDIIIEMGQEHLLKKNLSRVWVESAKVISIEAAGGGAKIKTLAIGQTRLRINDEIYKVSVVPIGSLKTFQDWSKFSQKFVQLRVDFCDEVVCLKGKIFQLSEFQKIIRLMNENNSTLYFAFEIHPSIAVAVQTYLDDYQREKGLTPLKVVYSDPWKIYYGNKDFANEYKSELAHVGVLALESKQKIEIADNIKVSIRVMEIKKEFGRTLGVKYPGTYSAQVLDEKSAALVPFDVSLNANELQGNMKVLASPNLVCRSGKEAEFFAGGEFPIRIMNYRVSDIVWKKYGIGLKIKPVIDSVGQMSLQIDSEISSLDESTKIDNIPGLQTNKVSSTFDLIRSRTIALSGLIKNEQGQSSEGLPYLRQIPILGRLFSSDDFRERRSELVIFVTPELLKNNAEAP